MNWLRMLFSPAGRIGRRDYNVVALVPAVLVFAGCAVAWAAVFRPKDSLFQWSAVSLSPARWGLLAVGVAAFIMGMWSFTALSAKRFHDRDKSAWWVSLWALSAAIWLVPGLITVNAAPLFQFPRYLIIPVVAITIIGFGSALWHTVELGFFKGTRGENRFGAPTQA